MIAIVAAPARFDTSRQERKLTNVEFVMDVSGSMESSFGDATRYDAAMTSIEYFTKRRKGDAFGLTIFGNEVLRWTPLTNDVSAIRNATPFLRPELLPQQFNGTEIGKAVKFCRTTLADRGDGDRMIILLSDGYSADLGPSRAREVGAELAADNIVIHAVHIGEGVAPSDLYDLTRPTNGQVFAANHPESLIDVFDQIDRMKPVELKSVARQQVFWYQPLALVGLGLLTLYVGSLFSLRYTPC